VFTSRYLTPVRQRTKLVWGHLQLFIMLLPDLNMDPEYCLLSLERNPVRQNPQQNLVFYKSGRSSDLSGLPVPLCFQWPYLCHYLKYQLYTRMLFVAYFETKTFWRERITELVVFLQPVLMFLIECCPPALHTGVLISS
jgi:hypothetical protein